MLIQKHEIDFMNITIKTLSIFVNDLAIKWSDDTQSLLNLKALRIACPCAGCSGEKDALGNIYTGPKKILPEAAFQISRYETVGRYGLRLIWKDGHHDGIYTFPFLNLFNNE